MIKQATETTIFEASDIIRAGGLVAMPTETVYGLAANALDGRAVAKIFEAKGRPSFNPLITHVASMDQAQTYGIFDAGALDLAQHFWPGPLTLIVRRKTDCPVSPLVTAGLDTIALRVPKHSVALSLIKEAGLPLAAPSANISGRLSSTTARHVARQLGDKIDLILAAGPSEKGLESTVLDVSGDKPVLLRMGAIALEELEQFCGPLQRGDLEVQQDKVKSPGLLQKHYAPLTPLRLNAVDVKKGEGLLAFGATKFMGLQGGGFARDLPEDLYRNLSENGDLNEAAANLFTMLDDLDNAKAEGIAVMSVPETGLGMAINDRLRRAASSQ